MPDDALETPAVRGYRIEQLIGSGGAATVYEAHRLGPGGSGERVACKVMHPTQHGSPRHHAKVWREAVIGLRVTAGHPHLVEVLDFFDDAEEHLCIVMELVDGATVRSMCPAGTRMSPPLVRRIALDVLEALAHLHGRGVLHRDVAPRNLLVTADGVVKLADLGIARVMEQGMVHTETLCVTATYASYEAFQMLPLDARADLYSLAAVLYELLSGLPPCGLQPTMAGVMAQVLVGKYAPLPPDTPADLVELVMGLLKRDRDERRPESAAAGLALLRAHDQPVASREELAAMVERGRARHDHEIAATLAEVPPGRVLEPGHVLSPWEGRALRVHASGNAGSLAPGGKREPAGHAVPDHVEDLLPDGLADAFVDALDGDAWSSPRSASPRQTAEVLFDDALDIDADDALDGDADDALDSDADDALDGDADDALDARTKALLAAVARVLGDDTGEGKNAPADEGRNEPAAGVEVERAMRRFSTRRAASVAAMLACLLVLGIWLGTRVRHAPEETQAPQPTAMPAPEAVPTPAPPGTPGTPESPQRTGAATEPRRAAAATDGVQRDRGEVQRGASPAGRAAVRRRGVRHERERPPWGQ